MSRSYDFRNKIAFEGIDASKFKEDVDVALVMIMLMWIAEGFVNPSRSIHESDLETICKEFFDCMNMLRKNLYKEPYL